ncbi:hypothetical protein FEZ30_03890 [Acidipropionibacterium acidipropionici]|nr:hypothetical protein FEZ30_03890 [Acidipropionibacterium acidipropionici]
MKLPLPAAWDEEPVADALEPPDSSGAWAQADRDRAMAEMTAATAVSDFFTGCLLKQNICWSGCPLEGRSSSRAVHTVGPFHPP